MSDLRDALESAMNEPELPAAPAEEQHEPEKTSDDEGEKGEEGTEGTEKEAAEVATAKEDAPAEEHDEEADVREGSATVTDRAPQAWKADVRDSWAKLPEGVRNEIIRRERDTERALQASAEARQVASELETMQREYAPALQAEGVDVITATRNLMGLASKLRFGTPVERAQLTAQIVRSYGVDVDALGAALSAGPHVQPAAPPADPRVERLLHEMQQMRQEQEQRIASRAQADIDAFSAGKEHFDDVRQDMADILEMAAKRGQQMSMDKAYERACALHPDVSAALASRKAAAEAKQRAAAAKAARAASSSIASSGAPATNARNPGDLRSDILAAVSAMDR